MLAAREKKQEKDSSVAVRGKCATLERKHVLNG